MYESKTGWNFIGSEPQLDRGEVSPHATAVVNEMEVGAWDGKALLDNLRDVGRTNLSNFWLYYTKISIQKSILVID